MSTASKSGGPNGGGGGSGAGSSKNKSVESLTEIFRCFICMEKLQDAHMCPHCSKLCCYSCIQRWLTETRTQCPHCRSSLLSHEVINCRWAEEVTLQLDTLLQSASSSSAVPGLLMPDKASRNPSSSLLLNDLMTQADQDKERCGTHSREQLSVYCTTCKYCICHECALWSTNHHGHTFKPIDEIYNVQCQQIKEHVLKLRRRFMELIGSSQEIEKNIDYATTTKDLHVREIRNSVEQMIGRLDSYLKSKLMTLVNQKGHLNRKSEEIDNLLQDIESQLSTCPKSELISIGTKLVTIIDETLQRCTFTLSPVTIDFQSEIIPKYNTCNVIVNKFSALREKGEPFYSESLQVYGHCWRLKIYPNGNGVVRGSYLSLFLELTAGPAEIAKYEYRIEMIFQNGFDSSKNMLREFSSDFEVGECWGYNRFFRLDLLESEGFWLPEIDVLQFKFDVRPTTYFQKCKDMDWYINQLKANQRMNSGETTAPFSIESSLSPLLSELSSRMGKLVVRNTTGLAATNTTETPEPTVSTTSSTVETTDPLQMSSVFASSSSSPGSSTSTTSIAEQLAAASSSKRKQPLLIATKDQLNGHPVLVHTSPTTTSIINISTYLANSAKNRESDNSMKYDSELVPSSSFYNEYMEICGVEKNPKLPDTYLASPDDDDEDE